MHPRQRHQLVLRRVCFCFVLSSLQMLRCHPKQEDAMCRYADSARCCSCGPSVRALLHTLCHMESGARDARAQGLLQATCWAWRLLLVGIRGCPDTHGLMCKVWCRPAQGLPLLCSALSWGIPGCQALLMLGTTATIASWISLWVGQHTPVTRLHVELVLEGQQWSSSPAL